MIRSVIAASLVAALAFQPAAFAQDAESNGGRNAERNGGEKKKDGPKPYDEVIPEDAESDRGLVDVHRVGDDLFFEIPPDVLGRDLLWVTQIEQTRAGFSYAGMPVGDRVVRWELRGERVLLRDVNYTIRAEVDDPIASAVEASNIAPIIRAFPVAAWGRDKAPVVNVSEFFTGDPSEFSAKRALDAAGVDGKRSFIEGAKAFPENVETRVLLTYTFREQREENGQGGPRGGGARRDPSQSGVSVVLHHSMVKLPDDKMKPREHDNRVGFFSVGFDDYADDSRHQVEEVRFITRWRLEKKDPEADVSDPVKPIVFYVGRGTPEKWKPWVKKGIEAWQPAFEAAGFSNAIVGKYAPTRQEDPDWDPEDARISVIRWLPSNTQNAFGPHVHDPRTGEILEADIRMYHNVMKLCRDWYFAQASACDERAQKLPLPDDLMGELLAYVVAHEVGHSLGFPHNMKASSTYTVAQLRDPEFTRKNGTEASIMDYGRFNYVAQPGDGAALIPVVGPYDHFAAEWGYRQFESEEAEAEGLTTIVARQVDDPMLRFGDPNPRQDPTQQTEDLGSDPVAATTLGLANIDRIMGFLVEATCEEGEDYDLLENMYGVVLGQRARELNHVANVVGGFERHNLWYGDAEQVWSPVDRERQRGAVAFLVEHAFQTKPALVDPDIVLRLEPAGAADRILGHQRQVLNSLMSEGRIKRMAEQAERADDAYLPAEMLADVRLGVWSELSNRNPEIDLYRRNLQRAHVDSLIESLNSDDAGSDMAALARGELTAIRDNARRVAGTATDPAVKMHLEHTAARIEQALDPRGAAAGG